jgi:hypothetical protein
MHVCIRTHTHIYIYIYIYMYMYIYIYEFAHAYPSTRTNSHTLRICWPVYMYIHTDIHKHIHTYTILYLHVAACRYMQVPLYAYAHSQIRKYARPCICMRECIYAHFSVHTYLAKQLCKALRVFRIILQIPQKFLFYDFPTFQSHVYGNRRVRCQVAS